MVNAETYDQNEAFWENYVKARPQIPDSFFERIFSYHAEHGGKFGVVHDAGAGVGIHSKRLAKRFDKVIVTDSSEENIQIAHKQLPEDGKFQLKTIKLEDTIQFPSDSVDMVFAATMMHFTDLDKAVDAVAHQLKPGGTFVVAFIGMVHLKDEPARTVWPKLYQAGNRKMLRPDGHHMARTWLPVASSSIDAVPMPEEYFLPGVQRIKLNYQDEDWYNHVIPPEYRTELPHWSQVGPNDVTKREADNEWNFKTNLAGLRDHMATFPAPQDTPGFAETWKELEDIIGEGEVDGIWPASLILATRK